MGFVSSLLGILGFGIGIPLGLLLGFFLFVYSNPTEVEVQMESKDLIVSFYTSNIRGGAIKLRNSNAGVNARNQQRYKPLDPVCRPLYDLDELAFQDLLSEIPLWVKNPNYHRVDWLNKFIAYLWPYLEKEIAGTIRSVAQPIFDEYTGKFQIESIEFERIDMGTLPPILNGLEVFETNEKELIMEPSIKWAGNPNIILVLKVLSLRITIQKLDQNSFQLVDLQVYLAPRIAFKPLVPSFPCFANIVVSLMEKPHIDFGMNILGADIMSIPGLYRFVQETIKKQVASLYLWPRTLEIPILDVSTVAVKKPVGILRVNVVHAVKLLKKDILGSSDPYVKLSLTGDGLPAKRTTIKKKNLNPEWNEKFKLLVKDPKTQILRLQVFDWDKVGGHDRIGMQLVALKQLTPHETKEFKLDLLKDMNISNSPNKKQRGQLVVELTFVPFKEDKSRFSGPIDAAHRRNESGIDMSMSSHGATLGGAGLLSVIIQGAENVEGKCHNNPYAILLFRGEQKKTHMLRKTRDPRWNEEFPFMLDEPPLNEKVHIEVVSKRTGISFRMKESLGHVEINLRDVVHNGRINHKYHLINSKNGVIHVEISWKMI